MYPMRRPSCRSCERLAATASHAGGSCDEANEALADIDVDPQGEDEFTAAAPLASNDATDDE